MAKEDQKNDNAGAQDGAGQDSPKGKAAKPAGPPMCNLAMARTTALGEGTRPAGFVMATAEFLGGDQFNPDSVKPADGVHASELATFLKNAHLVRVQPQPKS